MVVFEVALLSAEDPMFYVPDTMKSDQELQISSAKKFQHAPSPPPATAVDGALHISYAR